MTNTQILRLLKDGRWNTGLLTFFFLSTAVEGAVAGNVLLTIVGALATFITLSKTLQLHDAIKQLASKEEKSDGKKS